MGRLEFCKQGLVGIRGRRSGAGHIYAGQGTVAVADPDEWDDKGNPINGTPFAGYYNALFKSPAISLAGAASGTVKLSFSSSWRDECCDDGPSDTNNQTARIRVSYNNGASFSEVLRWESNLVQPVLQRRCYE